MELRSPEGHLQREVRCPRPSPPSCGPHGLGYPALLPRVFLLFDHFVSPLKQFRARTSQPSPPRASRGRPGLLQTPPGEPLLRGAEGGGRGSGRGAGGREGARRFGGRAPAARRSKGLAVQVRSPRGSLRSPVIKASAPRVSGRPSPRLPGRRAARPAGDQRSPGLHPKEAGPLPPPPHPHPPPAKPTGENRSRHPPGPRPSHPELPGGAGTRGPERVATCRGRANWLQRAGAGRRARGPPEVGPRLPRATSGLRGRGGAGAVPDLELPAQHRNAERLFITLRPPQPPNTAPPPRGHLSWVCLFVCPPTPPWNALEPTC
ncbi:basic proline-rich protein-like isoform X3 [Canis lupus familiaris]|uniref:basic proline-rich protein-like isoform X3 n=1 Tax=Canis lupus familiaris TaxID=9615 RepID=UPI0018F27AE7|nr:basic proline-rich protein-like isoform X3 [Canis lupus familiaris]